MSRSSASIATRGEVLRAIVAAADGADALREALGRYAFKSEVRAA